VAHISTSSDLDWVAQADKSSLHSELRYPVLSIPVGKTVGMRNKFNLKVNTHSASNGARKHNSKRQSSGVAHAAVANEPLSMDMEELTPEQPMIIRR
jgi:hypothetical protein